MAFTSGHSGSVEYVAESSYGDGIPTTPTMHLPSEAVTNVELNFDIDVKRLHDIGSHAATDTVYGSRAYVLTVEYDVQQLKSADTHTASTCLSYYATHRTTGALDSLACAVDMNGGAYLLKGGYINRLSMNFTQGEVPKATCEIWGNAVETDTTVANFSNYDSAGAIGESFESYSGAAITRSGCWSNGIADFSFEINNNLDRVFKVGSQDAASTYAGYVDLTGNATVLVATGAKDEVDALMAGTEVDIVAASGSTSSKSLEFTFANASYTNEPVIYKTDMSAMTVGCSWGAESVTFAAVS